MLNQLSRIVTDDGRVLVGRVSGFDAHKLRVQWPNPRNGVDGLLIERKRVLAIEQLG